MPPRLERQSPKETLVRLLAIIQLCFAFCLLLWHMAQPFMGEYFILRSRMLLYEYAMGTSEILKGREGQDGMLARQADRFNQLPAVEKERLERDYKDIRTFAKRPVSHKIEDGIQSLLRDTPPFELAWIFFSIAIAILILLKKEGAMQGAWLLPLIALCFAVDNQLTGKLALPPPDAHLFPKEQAIIEKYVQEPLAASPLGQKEQLERGWNLYLIDNWSPASLEEAQFAFTRARLNLFHGQRRGDWLKNLHEKSNPGLLFLFFAWNVFFAHAIFRKF